MGISAIAKGRRERADRRRLVAAVRCKRRALRSPPSMPLEKSSPELVCLFSPESVLAVDSIAGEGKRSRHHRRAIRSSPELPFVAVRSSLGGVSDSKPMDPMDQYDDFTAYALPLSTASLDMQASMLAVERILDYTFRDKRLLEEALTHSSYPDSTSYQRLEFVGDAVLGLALSNYVFLVYPNLDPGQLSLLRSANVSTEKLARVAVRHGLYRYVRHNAAVLDCKVKEFTIAVGEEDKAVVYGGNVKAPKILADIVESVAAAIYVDVGFDLQRLWVIFRGLLEPILTPEDLQLQPQPVTMLFVGCQKQGKQVDIKHWRKGSENIASVYVDGNFVASGSSENKEIAKLNAAKEALNKLWDSIPINQAYLEYIPGKDGSFEIEGAKHKLHELCGKKKWAKPIYSVEKDVGPSHPKNFISSVQIATVNGVIYMTGDEKPRIRDAENSSASLMIRALQESNYL